MKNTIIKKTLVLVTIIILSGMVFTPIITGDFITMKNIVSYKNQMITFSQNNTPPIANFTYEPTEIQIGDRIFFNDTSYDINGTIVAWWWQFGDGYYSDLQNCTHIYLIEGQYIVNLTVTDNNGSIGFIEKTLTILHQNDPPFEPYDPLPQNGEKNVDINITLSWNCSDPDNDPLTFDIYFSNVTPPIKVVSKQNENSWYPGELVNETTYYWQIVAWDDDNCSTSGPIWNFTTVGPPNDPPLGPIITGPDIVQFDVDFTFMFQTIDPDEDYIRFIVTWGDQTTDITDFNPHDTAIVLNHTWSSAASPIQILRMSVTAEDIHGAYSNVIYKWIIVMKTKNAYLVKLVPTQFIKSKPSNNNVNTQPTEKTLTIALPDSQIKTR